MENPKNSLNKGYFKYKVLDLARLLSTNPDEFERLTYSNQLRLF